MMRNKIFLLWNWFDRFRTFLIIMSHLSDSGHEYVSFSPSNFLKLTWDCLHKERLDGMHDAPFKLKFSMGVKFSFSRKSCLVKQNNWLFVNLSETKTPYHAKYKAIIWLWRKLEILTKYIYTYRLSWLFWSKFQFQSNCEGKNIKYYCFYYW